MEQKNVTLDLDPITGTPSIDPIEVVLVTPKVGEADILAWQPSAIVGNQWEIKFVTTPDPAGLSTADQALLLTGSPFSENKFESDPGAGVLLPVPGMGDPAEDPGIVPEEQGVLPLIPNGLFEEGLYQYTLSFTNVQSIASGRIRIKHEL